MRWSAPLLLALAGAACSPDIGKGTYYCGPERFCPPDMECDDPSYTCESPRLAQPFACPTGSQALEPDDSSEQAPDEGSLACGDSLVGERIGCIAGEGDEDVLGFDIAGECVGDDPHLEVTVRFPIAFVPLAVDLLDESGATLVEGVLCTPSGDATGTDRLCIEQPLAPGRYYLRVRAAPDGPDCDGDCHHNQYTLIVGYPLA
jgi:hypothetical protein